MMMEMAIGVVGVIVFAFVVYVVARLRESRRPVAPQVKGPIQRHMEKFE